jgi:hypothetical protein
LELEARLDHARSNIEQSVARTKSDRVDKDVRLQMLEGELERVKHTSLGKDVRVEELERAHQEDRFKIVSLKEKLQLAERAAIDAAAALELEKAQRERAEKRLAAATAELTHHRSPGPGMDRGGPPTEDGEHPRMTGEEECSANA